MLFNIAVANLLINQAENSEENTVCASPPPHHVKNRKAPFAVAVICYTKTGPAGPILAEKIAKISPPDHFCYQNGPTGPLLAVISRGQTALFAQGRYHFQYKRRARKSARRLY